MRSARRSKRTAPERETWSEACARVNDFIEAHRTDKPGIKLSGPGIKIVTHEDVIKELERDHHNWHPIENGWSYDYTFKERDPVRRLRIYLWCQWCGVFAEHVSLTMNGDTPGAHFRYHQPGKPDDWSSTKPPCIVRTHPPPGLTIHWKE